MFQDHDGRYLFDVSFGRSNHDFLGHQFRAGLVEEVLELLGIFADAAGINLGADEGQARDVRLRAAVHEVGTGDEADEMVFFIDDGHGQQAVLDENAEDVADGNIRRYRDENLFHDIFHADNWFFFHFFSHGTSPPLSHRRIRDTIHRGCCRG